MGDGLQSGEERRTAGAEPAETGEHSAEGGGGPAGVFGARRPRIDDVARLAGVSAATVSRALRDLPNVAAGTRHRVHEAAAELGYKADPNASRLASGRARTVGLVAPLFDRWYASTLVAGIERVLSAADYDLLIFSAEDPSRRHDFVERSEAFQSRVDGLVMVDFFVEPGYRRMLERLRVPVVTIGDRVDPHPGLSVDNHLGARLAAEHLIQLGHTRIAVISGHMVSGHESPVPGARMAGFREAMGSAGLGFSNGLVADGDFTTQGGELAMASLLAMGDPPTAVFCFSDEMAAGALEAARSLGVAVPGDVSIVGFDDHDLAAVIGLTTVRQQVRILGERGALRLLAEMAEPGSGGPHEVCDVELIVRRTTGAVPVWVR
jgi:DNA-binding LacI/PurR family transcriptional regulator